MLYDKDKLFDLPADQDVNCTVLMSMMEPPIDHSSADKSLINMIGGSDWR